MQPFSISLSEPLIQTRNGVYWSETPQIREVTSLSDVVSGKGDHKSPSPHKYDRLSLKYPYGKYEYFEDWGAGYLWKQEGPFSNYSCHEDPEPYPVAAVYNKALDKFYGAIRNSDLNLAVDLAEGKQTIRMVADATRALISLKKIALRAASKPATSLAKSWLGAQYGWRPLLSTLHDLAEFAQSNYLYRRVKVRSSQSFERPTVFTSTISPSYRYRTRMSYRVELSALYEVVDSRLFDASRLSSLDPAVIAWELLPFSFVVDWVFDIGSYLAAVEQANLKGLAFVEGYRTDTYLKETTGEYDGRYEVSGPSYKSFQAKWSVRRTGLDRKVLTSFPRPTFPQFKVDLGSSQLLSAAALLQTIFLSRRA